MFSAIKTLSKSLRQHRRNAILTIILTMLAVVWEILIPLKMADLLDFGINQNNLSSVAQYGAVLIALASLQLITGTIGARVAAKASAGFAANLRQDIYNHVQTFAFSNIDKFSTASIITRLTTDVSNVQNAFQMIIRMAIRAPFMLIFQLSQPSTSVLASP